MLLESITLKNIRSYTEQTISLREGATLLAGDIGTGKSSILLAIEFALFGTSRPDLPANALLRKGETSGSVELTFTLHNQRITIKRSIKKDSRSIKQTAGHIILNDRKEDLMPIELKAKIMALLGYPEDLLTKNKNYIFRYTVYTPQEAMKHILQESEDTRLDVLRKIFNVDKYKNIRNNVFNVLRDMRTQIAVLESKIEPLDSKKVKIVQLQEDNVKIVQELQIIEPIFQKIQSQKKEKEEKLEEMRKKQQEYQFLVQDLANKKSLLEDKQKQLEDLTVRKNSIDKEIEGHILKEDVDLESLQRQVKKLEEKRKSTLDAKSLLEGKIAGLQDQINLLQKETSVQIPNKEEKETMLRLIKKELEEKEVLMKRRNEIEQLFENIMLQESKYKATIEHISKRTVNIGDLQDCPTCLQQVPHEHKQQIISSQQKELEGVHIMLRNAQSEKEELLVQKTGVIEKINHLDRQQQLGSQLRLEVDHIKSQESQREERKKVLREYVVQSNQLMKQVTELEDVKGIEKELTDKKEKLDSVTHYNLLVMQKNEVEQNVTKIQEELNLLKGSLEVVEENLSKTKDVAQDVAACKLEIEKDALAEKEKLIEKNTLLTKQEHIVEQLKEGAREIEELTEHKNKLIRHKELHHWLDEFFIKLTYTIEKRVMLHIHHLFNDLFQEWFSILIDDENMYGRIDDTFSPVIEQNGHEISFVNLSGGERTSAALAYRLALNRVINDVVAQIQTKDLLILDEPTDGFSAAQLDKVRDVLDKLGLRQVLIVSHENKIESFVDNVLRVEKREGVSVVG